MRFDHWERPQPPKSHNPIPDVTAFSGGRTRDWLFMPSVSRSPRFSIWSWHKIEDRERRRREEKLPADVRKIVERRGRRRGRRRGGGGRHPYTLNRARFLRLLAFSPTPLYATLVAAHCELRLGYSSPGSNIPRRKIYLDALCNISLVSPHPKKRAYLSETCATAFPFRVFYITRDTARRALHATNLAD